MSKLSSKPGSRKKSELNAVDVGKGAGPVDETETPPQAEHEFKERRSGYQTISTAAYYRTERRGSSGFGKEGSWEEIGGMPGIDGMDSLPE